MFRISKCPTKRWPITRTLSGGGVLIWLSGIDAEVTSLTGRQSIVSVVWENFVAYHFLCLNKRWRCVDLTPCHLHSLSELELGALGEVRHGEKIHGQHLPENVCFTGTHSPFSLECLCWWMDEVEVKSGLDFWIRILVFLWDEITHVSPSRIVSKTSTNSHTLLLEGTEDCFCCSVNFLGKLFFRVCLLGLVFIF